MMMTMAMILLFMMVFLKIFAELDQPGKDRGWVEGARGEIVAELVPIVAQVANLGISYILH